MKGCLDLEKKNGDGGTGLGWAQAGPGPRPPGPGCRKRIRGPFSFHSDALSCHCKIYENTATHTHCGNIHGTIWLER